MPTEEAQNNRLNEARERMHQAMLSSVSHDLKTPLSSIIGSLEIYERMKDKLPPEKRDLLIRTALQEAYRLDNFITNILDMAKLENRMVKMHIKDCDIDSLVKDCVTEAERRLHGHIQLIPLTPGLLVHTDAALLCRAISLLLDNAVRYSGASPKIRVEYGQEGGECFIRIYDNGPGFPADMAENIFSKYTRFSKQDQTGAGTGLGLAICREIMALLRGSVSGENRLEGGALFMLRLPVR